MTRKQTPTNDFVHENNVHNQLRNLIVIVLLVNAAAAGAIDCAQCRCRGHKAVLDARVCDRVRNRVVSELERGQR